jgi:hypothetical protein
MNEILYKYWFFYIKPEYLHLVCTEEDDSLLYAYTDNKEIAKLFKQQRDIDKFFVVKREIEKDEVNHLAKYFMREYLLKKSLKTKINNIGSDIIEYEVALTTTEDIMIKTTASKLIMIDIWTYSWIDPNLFTVEYQKALEGIGITSRYNILTSWKNSPVPVDKTNGIEPDLLSIFIKEYGFLLSLKKERNNT